jgi:hypothetical protein
MNSNTAGAFRAACSQVLGVEDDWENPDVRAMDVFDAREPKTGAPPNPRDLATRRRHRWFPVAPPRCTERFCPRPSTQLQTPP